jgi:predicted dehydrogenase
MNKHVIFFLVTAFLVLSTRSMANESKAIRLAVAGMSHGHISFILDRPAQNDFELVGLYEADQELSDIIADRYQLSDDLLFADLENMLDEVKPEAVAAFGSVFDHLAVVEACAPRGIDVMVEKPLAVNMDHARRMQALAEKFDIHLLTNYETSWYPTTEKSLGMVQEQDFIGQMRNVIFHHGHNGPVEIGCDRFFLDWLTDPVLNGGGAIVDFGCYGANLMTALTEGIMPESVTAVTRRFKPEVYERVDDDATIIVSYPESQCIIQASWNWPFNRKDMEIYGVSGYIIAENSHDMRMRKHDMPDEKEEYVTTDDVSVYDDPFDYFADVINGKIDVAPYGLYSLENNMRVVQILDAARKSAETGETIYFRE